MRSFLPFVLACAPAWAAGGTSPPAQPDAPTPAAAPDAPPTPPPVAVTPAPPPGPSPQALATWEAQQLGRVVYTEPVAGWEDAGWGVATGSGRQLTTAEFAALTGDADKTLRLRRELSIARSDRGWLYAIGGGLELLALTQLAGAGTGSSAEEDRLWRGLVLGGVGLIPIAIGPLRVKGEQERARHVALHYSPQEAEGRIRAYNASLSAQLGVTAPPGVVVLPPDPPETVGSEDQP